MNNKKHFEIGKIMGTKDISFFKCHENNRKISKTHIKKLKNAIKKQGLLDPIKIVNDGTIIDGHHRFLAIKELINEGVDILIKYIIIEAQDEINTIINLNANSKGWGIGDYIEIYAKAKNEQYQKIIDIAEKYNQTSSSVFSVLSCGSDVKRYKEMIKNGEDLDFDEWDLLDEYYAWIETLKPYMQFKSKVKQMLFRLYLHDKFSPELFYMKIKQEYININERVRFSSSQNICKQQLLKIYNKGQHKNSKTRIDYVMDSDGKIILVD